MSPAPEMRPVLVSVEAGSLCLVVILTLPGLEKFRPGPADGWLFKLVGAFGIFGKN